MYGADVTSETTLDPPAAALHAMSKKSCKMAGPVAVTARGSGRGSEPEDDDEPRRPHETEPEPEQVDPAALRFDRRKAVHCRCIFAYRDPPIMQCSSWDGRPICQRCDGMLIMQCSGRRVCQTCGMCLRCGRFLMAGDVRERRRD